MSEWTVSKLSGWAMIAAAVLVIVATLIVPSYASDSLESLDIAKSIDVRASDGELHNISSLLSMGGGLLLLLGLLTIRRAAQQETVPDLLVRFGVVIIAVAIIFSIAGHGLNKMIVHVLQHGELEGMNGDRAVAFALQGGRYALTIALWITGTLGTLALGLGLYAKFAPGYQKWVSLLAAVVSALAFVGAVLAEFAHDLTEVLVVAFGLYLLVMAIWYLLLGVALVNEDSDLAPSA